MEFCNILKSNASFSFFPFISSIFNLRLPAVIFLFLFRAFFILFSTLVTYHSPILLSLIFPSLNFYFTLYKYPIFSKSSSPCPQFFLLFFRYNNSILGRRDSTSNIPAYNSFFRSFLGFSTTTSLSLDRDQTAKMERPSREGGHLVTENWKLGYSTRRTHRFSLRTLIGLKNGREKNGGRKGELATYLIAILFAFKWCHRWFISSSRRCSITASSWLAKELNSFRPVPFNDVYTSRCVSISDWRSCNKETKYSC